MGDGILEVVADVSTVLDDDGGELGKAITTDTTKELGGLAREHGSVDNVQTSCVVGFHFSL